MSNRPYTWTEKACDHSYDDIIHLSRPVSKKHKPMSMAARAAQFSPYDALTGYSDEIKETARITDGHMTLSPEEQDMLDTKTALLIEAVTAAGKYGEKPEVTILYFIPDRKKDGGSFAEISGTVKTVDTVNRKIILKQADTTICLDDVADIQSSIFQNVAINPCSDV